MNEHVEVSARTVELAVQHAMEELGIEKREQATVEIVQEPEKGFLGLGGQQAVVKVQRKSESRSRRRQRGSRDTRGKRGTNGRDQAQNKSKRPSGGDSGQKKAKDAPKRAKGPMAPAREEKTMEEPTSEEIADQVTAIDTFLSGLLDSFGLEGKVSVRDEEGVIYAEVTGDQTEALVGPKGSVMAAVQELSRTVIQRQSRNSARVRVDIANYRARRSEALVIYTTRLTEQLLEDGGEVMLEAMNAADRKVVHDTANEIEGVTTFSEGREPRRSVVLSVE
jgi:spoIIIJ-associated protein